MTQPTGFGHYTFPLYVTVTAKSEQDAIQQVEDLQGMVAGSGDMTINWMNASDLVEPRELDFEAIDDEEEEA